MGETIEAKADDTKVRTIAKRKPQPAEQLPAPVSDTAAVVALIERAARDPSVDINKMKELLILRREMEDRAAKFDFDDAMMEAQTEMRPIAADAVNPQTRSKYASYAALD